MTRRRFGRLAGAGVAALALGIPQAFKSLRGACRAALQRHFPGRLRAFDERDMQKEGRWKG